LSSRGVVVDEVVLVREVMWVLFFGNRWGGGE
jgi:hypothetical protein